ncbi:hypothetical protein ACIBEJ_42855 [Nonomuraea sp. NPDC050790]|uniref:hypothetical protein n=1 Tax=Nonomuraea sp. NPDC050790 TaxID=3364371 RepID=UPI0037BB66A0
MVMFTCSRCGTAVTRDLAETGYPPARNPPPRELHEDAPQLIPRGRFAMDPEPFGVLVPIPVVDQMASDEVRDTILVNADDLIAVEPHPNIGEMGSGCCGWDPHGPNVICAACGQGVAALANDCGMPWHWVRLFPDAVLGAPPPRSPQHPERRKGRH